MINIVPVFDGHEDFTISEILRQKKDVGIDKVALSLSYHPQGAHAADLVPQLCKLFKTIADGVAGHGVEVGALIQSTMGHGWGKFSLTDEPWQQIILANGTPSSRMCMTDSGFCNYIRMAIAETVKAGASFLLIDDDFGLRHYECFCPNHLKLYGETLGREVTREELLKMFEERHFSDPEVMKIGEVRRKNVQDFAQLVREAIDSVDPTVRCGMCTPYNGYSFVGKVAQLLAGKTEPFIRINCAVYGMQPPSSLYGASDMIFHVKHYIGDTVKDLIAESDTFNQCYYSESARLFHAHVTNGFLCGLNGSKLWTSEFANPIDTGSQKRYEEKLRENRGFYAELLKTMNGASWEGIAAPLYKVKSAMHPMISDAQAQSNWCGSPQNPLFGNYSFPITYAVPGAAPVIAVTKYDVDNMSDEEIDALFDRGVLIDCNAAKALTQRGFSALMGVEAAAVDETHKYNHEYKEDVDLRMNMVKEDTMAVLTPLSDEVRVFTWLCSGRVRSTQHIKDIPGSTFFTNSRGGRVVVTAWTPEQPFYRTMHPVRRNWLQEIADFLNGGVVEMGLDNAYQQTLVRHSKLADGKELVSFINMALDELDELVIHLVRTPVCVEKLLPDGSWQKLAFERINDLQIKINEPLRICDPLILRMTF